MIRFLKRRKHATEDPKEMAVYAISPQQVYDNQAYSPEPNEVQNAKDTIASSSTKSDLKPSDDIAMKKSINLFHATGIMIAVTGSASVFISPSFIVGYSGSVGMSLIMWLVGGLINLCLALSFAELGTMYPKAGGPYAYTKQVFGPLPGFLIMWGYVILIAGSFWAYLAFTAALYIVQPFFPSCSAPDVAINLLGAWIMGKIIWYFY